MSKEAKGDIQTFCQNETHMSVIREYVTEILSRLEQLSHKGGQMDADELKGLPSDVQAFIALAFCGNCTVGDVAKLLTPPQKSAKQSSNR